MDKKTIIELIKRNIIRLGMEIFDNVIAYSNSNSSNFAGEVCIFYDKEADVITVSFTYDGDKVLLKIDNLDEISVTSIFYNGDEIICAISGIFSSTTGRYIETRNRVQDSQMGDLLYKFMEMGLLSFGNMLVSHFGITLSDIGIDAESIEHRTNKMERLL